MASASASGASDSVPAPALAIKAPFIANCTSTRPPSAPLPLLCFLVVDDVVSNRKLLTRVLKGKWKGGSSGSSATFDEAADGREAVAMVEASMQPGQQAYDVIVMDAQMPIMTGYEATRQIRAMTASQPAHQQPIVIGCTGNALDEDQQTFRDAGAAAVVIKPVSAQGIFDLLNRLLAERRSQS